jgi:hypothetical protein
MHGGGDDPDAFRTEIRCMWALISLETRTTTSPFSQTA